MRLRTTLIVAFLALAVLQVAIVVPLALRNLSALLSTQHESRVDQLMVAVVTERDRLRTDLSHAMSELAASPAMEEAARDAAQVPAPPTVTHVAAQLMKPRGLDVLALLDDDGRTISSGHLPARLGDPDDPLFAATQRPAGEISLLAVEVSNEAGLQTVSAAVTARRIDYGERRLWAVGGILLNDARANAFSRLSGARVEFLKGAAPFAQAGSVPEPTSTRSLQFSDGYSLRLHFSRADLHETKREVVNGFASLTLVGLLLSLIAGVLVSRRVTKPVEALTEAAARIASGEPGTKVELQAASQELRDLMNTFNRMTEDLKNATDKLVASERVAAWQEVARRVAHEIKNPLTPIRMSLETLLAASQRQQLDGKFQQLFKDSANAVLEEVDRLKRIVDEFSQFARLPKPELKPLNLSEAVKQIMALYADRNGLSYSVNIAEALHVSGDRDQLTQVLVNLLKNAEEAMSGSSGTIRVSVTQNATLIVIAVQDEGPGIPPDLKARLFEPYVTTKAHGTGLGLAIASRIVQEHGGTLTVHDVEPRGARFEMALPRISG